MDTTTLHETMNEIPQFDVDAGITLVLLLDSLEFKVEGLRTAHLTRSG